MRLEHPSLLITDDDRDFRETLREVFARRGFQTLLAADGAEALDIVQGHEVHLALLDMHMPRLTGLETLRRFQQAGSRLPCILMSAALDEAIIQAALEANAYKVLSKPIHFQEITGVVRDALRQAYGWREEGS